MQSRRNVYLRTDCHFANRSGLGPGALPTRARHLVQMEDLPSLGKFVENPL
jgi:hypothetical protein